ncbi:hypothetical protein BH160DRAFT_1021 [Burkholderia sp. H160]|nr:hypothetical protein BH160DRAFT_1021 [Burkholderia sp. H160]
MMRALLRHDRLVPPGNPDAYLEVIDPSPRAGSIKVFDAQLRADRYIDMASVVADVHKGTLSVLRAGKPRFSHAAQPDDETLHERSSFIREAMQRIQAVQKQRGVSFQQAYRLVAEQYSQVGFSQARPLPPQSTMYRYRKALVAGLPPLRGNKNKGNREPRYSQEVIDTIRTAAELLYLVPHSRWSLKRVTNDVNLKVHGTLLPETRPQITARYVKNTILRVASADPELDRMLPSDVVAGKSLAKNRIRAEVPFERVEQDAVHLPFVVETPSGISSQVYLVHAVDCCTSVPLGWNLCVGAPTDRETLACVEMYTAPRKLERFKALGLDLDMNMCGTAGQIVFDNGAETKTSRIQNLQKLGTDVKHCRARAAHEKPFIERLNRSLKEALEGLGGCTRLDGKDGKRDPIQLGDELPTMEVLERWIVRWYYERWIHTPLERLRCDAVLTGLPKGSTPAERWKYFEASYFPISLPPSHSEWLAALYEHAKRTLSRKTGITVNNLNYRGDEIDALINTYGEHCLLDVLFNPDDFRYVYVYEGDDRPPVALPFEYLTSETPAWSFKDATALFEKPKRDSKPAPEAQKFDRDMHEKVVADSLAQKSKKPKKSGVHERNRETARGEKEVKAVARAAQSPGPQPPSTPGSSGQVASAKPTVAMPSTGSMLDDESLFPVLDRNSGGLKQ